MFSKIGHKLIIAALITVNIGCGIKLGEENKSAKVAAIKGTDCLKPSTESLKKFIAGDATDDEVSEASECLQKVVLTFKDNMRGKDKHSYTAEELFGFVQNQFLKDSETKFSPALISEIMKFKVLLFGGTTDVIQKTEIEAISSFMARFTPGLVRLNPHMKVIVSKWKFEEEKSLEDKEQKFTAAKEAFDKVMMSFSDFVVAGGRTYKLQELIGLIEEFAKFSGSKAEVITRIENLKVFILKSKLILIGGDDSLKGKEWNAFHHTLVELFFQTLRVKYFITPFGPEQKTEKLYGVQKIGEDVVGLIAELLQGRGAKELKNTEIMELLAAAKPLAPDIEITPELVNQIGKIKMMLLGKSENGFASWSTAEFLKLKESLPWIFGHAKVFAIHFKNLKFNKTGFRNNEIKLEDFLASETAVVASVKEISSQLKYGYDLADLKLLVLNAKPLLKDITLPENLEELFQLAGTAKYTLTGEPGSALTIDNLRLLLNVGISGYGNAVQFANFAAPFKLQEPEFVANLEPVLMKGAGTVRMLLEMKKSHVISTQELTPLVLAAQNAKVITTKFQKESLDKAFNVLWTNLFNTPANRIAGNSLPGFNGEALANLSVEALYWVQAQKNITAIFSGTSEYKKEELTKILTDRLAASKSPLDKASLAELARLLAAPGLMNFNEKGYLKIMTDREPVNGKYHVDDMIKSNLARAMSRLLIRTLAKDITRVNTIAGMTLEELREGFDQLKFLGYDIGLLDPANPDFIGGRFREASLFLSPSNGDEFAGFEESHHLILHILSGIDRANSLEKTQNAQCIKEVNTEAMAKTEFDTACLLDLYLAETEPFEDMPEFLKLRSDRVEDGSPKYTPEKNKQYFCALLKAAGHIPTANKTVLLKDAKLFTHVVQYVEMIFSTHDANKNGLLEMEEGLSAFPIFKSTIAPLVKPYPIIKEEDLPGVFIYLLKHGKPPAKTQLFTFAQFVKDHKCTNPDGTPKECRKGWNIQATRHTLGSIFNFIADATKPVVPVDPSAPPAPPTGDPCETVVPPPPAPAPVPPSNPSNPSVP